MTATAHPGCEQGHICQQPSGLACREPGAACTEPAGTRWSPYYCPDHDRERINRIARQLDEILGDHRARNRRDEP